MKHILNWVLYYYFYPYFIWSMIYGIFIVFSANHQAIFQFIVFMLIPFFNWIIRTKIDKHILNNNIIVFVLFMVIYLLSLYNEELRLLKYIIGFPFYILMEVLTLVNKNGDWVILLTLFLNLCSSYVVYSLYWNDCRLLSANNTHIMISTRKHKPDHIMSAAVSFEV